MSLSISSTNTAINYSVTTSSVTSTNNRTAIGGSGSDTGVRGFLGGGPDQVKLSGPAEFFKNLQQLQSQDPVKFKALASQIARQIKDVAEQITGGASSFLTSLADKFQQVATTGDLSALQPQRPHHGHGQTHATYNRTGQVTEHTLPPPDSNGPPDLVMQLFEQIKSKVTSALTSTTV